MSAARRVEALAEFLIPALGELEPRERFVFECRYGLRGDREYSQAEIASLMGVSQSTVSRLLQDALATLQNLADAVHNFRILDEADSEPALEDGVDGSVCLSPFIPSQHGFPPGTLPDGIREEWMCQDGE